MFVFRTLSGFIQISRLTANSIQYSEQQQPSRTSTMVTTSHLLESEMTGVFLEFILSGPHMQIRPKLKSVRNRPNSTRSGRIPHPNGSILIQIHIKQFFSISTSYADKQTSGRPPPLPIAGLIKAQARIPILCTNLAPCAEVAMAVKIHKPPHVGFGTMKRALGGPLKLFNSNI